MISFIIIGRNEGEKLKKCFKSITSIADKCRLINHEIIYVDSNSTDNSIEIALEFNITNIYKLIGEVNAAIARNLGAEKSVGQILCFIDGDMELQSQFLAEVYNFENSLLKYDFVSGDFLNFYYDYNGKFLSKQNYFNNKKLLIQQEVGGIFLISRENWIRVNGMRSVFKRSQDIDFALRLARVRIFLKRLPTIAATHHTIDYNNNKRKWKMIFSRDELYGRSLLYRKNFLNRYMYKRLLFHDYSALILLFCTISIIFNVNYNIFVIYLSILLLRSRKKSMPKVLKIFDNILYYIVRDLSTILGFLLFYPKTPQKLDYIRIK